MAEQIHEHLDAIEGRLNLGLRPALVELVFYLREGAQLFGRDLLWGGLVVFVLAAHAQVERQAGFGDFHRSTVGSFF